MGVPDVAYFTKRLKAVLGLAEVAYNFRLSILPPFETVDSIKTFCTAFSLNKPPAGFHRGELSGAGPSFITGKECGSRHKPGRREWQSLCHTLFMFRKVLPSPPADLDGLCHKLQKESVPDPEFIQCIDKIVSTQFKMGWDKSFAKALDGTTIPLKSYLQKKKDDRRATSRRYILGRFNRDEFRDFVMRGALPINRRRRLAVVREAGKSRVVTIADAFQHAFAPFSTIFYNHLSKKSWLCRGDVSPVKMKDFVRKEGEVFVSGDYESATDSLNMAHSKAILRAVLGRCTFLPPHYGSALLDSLDAIIVHDDSEFVMSSGQLMGDKLSFPLLCLYNFIAFKSCIRRKVPLKINGDDIAFRGTRDEAESWCEGVGRSGLVLHRGKTQISPTFFSLNSVVFEARDVARPRLVPFIRSKPFCGKKDENCYSLGDRSRAGLVGHHTANFRRSYNIKFVTFNMGWHRKSHVSLFRGHKILVCKDMIVKFRLWDTECFYRSALPRDDKLLSGTVNRPAGLISVPFNKLSRGILKETESVVVERFVEHSWSTLSLDVDGRGQLPGRLSFLKQKDKYDIKNRYFISIPRQGNFEEIVFSRRVHEPVIPGRTVLIPVEDALPTWLSGGKRGIGYH